MATFKLLTDSVEAPATGEVERAFPLSAVFSRLAQQIVVVNYGATLYGPSYACLWFYCICDRKFQLLNLVFFNHKGITYFRCSAELPRPRPYNPKWAGDFLYPEASERIITVTSPKGALDIDQLEFLDVKIGFGRLTLECRTASLDHPCTLAIVVDTRNPLPQLHCYTTSNTLSPTALS